ncbi:magnesium and cobalt efflux protein CorC [bacterium BMS3Abin03]|nr:magnesium and cobalt efflux protein CorC [bacterium BMS3Abin03]
MDSIIFELIVFLLLILLAGFLEAAEISLSSYGENKIDELREQNHKLTPYFEKIIENEESFFGSVQIVYVFSIISATLLGFHLLLSLGLFANIARIFFTGNPFLLAFILLLILFPPIVVIFCVLIPKAIGFKYADELALRSVRALLLLSKIFKLPVLALTGISNFLLKPIKERTNFSQTRPSEDEILDMISDGVKSGAIDEKEQEIIENILEFNDLKANEVMVPRTEMVAVDLNEDEEQILKEILNSGHSLVPAFEETPDNIVGVIHTKDFMKKYIMQKEISIKNLLRPAYFIPETKLISEVLKEMQQIGERLAIVTDEYGGTEGVITLEDVLEEIVGEIKDKSKTEVSDFSKLPDGTFCILGSMDIDDFNETFNFKLPESDEYNTIAGFIADRTGKILNVGESFKNKELHFELIKKTRQKMVQFKVYSERENFGVANKEQNEGKSES